MAGRLFISACSHSISTSLFLETVSCRRVNDGQRGAGCQVAQSDSDSIIDRMAGIDETGITEENGGMVGRASSVRDGTIKAKLPSRCEMGLTMTSAEQLFLDVISKVSDEDHAAGELEEDALGIDPPFVANEQAPSIAKPGEEPLDLPSMPLAALQTTLPTRCSFAIVPLRADQPAVRHHHSRCSFSLSGRSDAVSFFCEAAVQEALFPIQLAYRLESGNEAPSNQAPDALLLPVAKPPQAGWEHPSIVPRSHAPRVKPLLAALRLDLQKLHDLLKIHFEAIGIIAPARVQ